MHQTCASDSLNLPGPQHINKVCLERHLTEREVAGVGEPPAVSDNNGGDGIRHSRAALDTEGIILIDWLPSGATSNGPRYVLTLRRLRRAIQPKGPGERGSGGAPSTEKAPPHTPA